ncbi:unnamed protein product [Brassicogethes aeneus]|uniref:Uncharacterized protein n=1 Tax=Brassicogethes aeneus TaxID=1431903 RepID=A0A9P0B1W3_BRAAE|nr:unnamed protein product [Brassicogethes aeneus]
MNKCCKHGTNNKLKRGKVDFVCNLPKEFKYPAEPHGYSIQDPNKHPHPFYVTTSTDYGRLPPRMHDLVPAYYPRDQAFTNLMSLSNPYRNYSLNH